jgi:predicted glycosyltransferase
VPIIEELKRRGYSLLLTSRDNAQVLELLQYNHLHCRHFGHHYGRRKLLKVLGLGLRALELAPLILREKPDLALSHGSRSQIVLSSLLGIPSLAISDYEHTKMRLAGIKPKWLMVPEVITDEMLPIDATHVFRYPGIKEDVYVPRFRPRPGIRQELGLTENDFVITIRPPASDAHYHNPKSDELFHAVVTFLSAIDGVRMVLLPRNDRQAEFLRKLWPNLFRTGKVRTPERVVDGLNLLWFSDIVISGGGTMNREAAALGVPVYSIFRGELGAVDRYLAATGRLTCLEGAGDLNAMRLVRRERPRNPKFDPRPALTAIVENIVAAIELECTPHETPNYRG